MEDLKELDPINDIIDTDEEARIFSEMAKIEGLSEYLRLVMSRDIKLHFNTPTNQQDLVKGGFYRTKDFAKKLAVASNKNLTSQK